MSLQKNIRDLIFFYVKTNYNEYLTKNEIKIIPESEIDSVIHSLYVGRKEHIKVFIKESLKTLYESKPDEYPGDQTVNNMLLNIFHDDELCKNRLSVEIKLHQQKMKGEKNDYSKLL
jgi:hypothetical protein